MARPTPSATAADTADSPSSLDRYYDKRDFSATPEPRGEVAAADEHRIFVVQKHDASHLHYDFRLELDGTLKSWAVPKGPSLDPAVKRMAVHVEDHPLSYASFEGTIPEGHYGAGNVIVWDAGTWQAVGDAAEGYRKGRLKFDLVGRKLRGRWNLVRMKRRGDERSESWLLMKDDDTQARPATDYDVLEAEPDSVLQPGKGLPARSARGAKRASARKAASAADASSRIGGTTGSASKSTSESVKAAPVPTAATKKSAGSRAKGAVAAAPAAAAEAGPATSTSTPKRSVAANGPAAVPLPAQGQLPDTLSPQLATLVDRAPEDLDDWCFEAKLDGYRLLARIDGDDVRLLTRNGNDWTAKLGPLADQLRSLRLPDAWIDGEVVAAGPRGTPDFQVLQGAFDGQDTSHLVYFAFDLPYYEGRDLRNAPLEQRRTLLRNLVGNTPGARVRFCETLQGDPDALLAEACRHGFEGLIGKRRNGAYVGRRSPDWIKLKCSRRQEFVIGGWTDPQGARTGLGALLLGVYDAQDALQYVGLVGTGFDEPTLADLRTKLDSLAADKSPFAGRKAPRGAHFVQPELVAEVVFGEWTREGALRHPVFHGLRTDKPAASVVREEAVAPSDAVEHPAVDDTPVRGGTRKKGAGKRKADGNGDGDGNDDSAASLAGLRITHPERVMDATTGATKLHLLRYYAEAAPLMLPFLAERPVALLRLPDGVGGEAFFQKHADAMEIAGARRLDPAYDPGHAPLMVLDTAKALLSAVQMNAVEFHTWNAVLPSGKPARLATPDRLAFDLDPGEGVGWPQVREAAQLLHAFLDELGLASFLKTSGGKGLHVVVPLRARLDWDTVKGFSQKVAQHMARVIPDRFVAKSGPRNRVGRIYIDYLRNGFGATTVSAWSVRGRPGLGVSVPVGWDELPGLTGGAHWTVATVSGRFATGNTPWDGYADAAQSLDRAIAALD